VSTSIRDRLTETARQASYGYIPVEPLEVESMARDALAEFDRLQAVEAAARELLYPSIPDDPAYQANTTRMLLHLLGGES
jgi:hypothetical protein